MKYEDYSDKDLEELIQDLSDIGLIPLYRVVVSVVARPNEFLLTNVKNMFLSWKKKLEGTGVSVEIRSVNYEISHRSIYDRDYVTHQIILIGESRKIEIAYEDILSWNWVDPEKTEIESRDLI